MESRAAKNAKIIPANILHTFKIINVERGGCVERKKVPFHWGIGIRISFISLIEQIQFHIFSSLRPNKGKVTLNLRKRKNGNRQKIIINTIEIVNESGRWRGYWAVRERGSERDWHWGQSWNLLSISIIPHIHAQFDSTFEVLCWSKQKSNEWRRLENVPTIVHILPHQHYFQTFDIFFWPSSCCYTILGMFANHKGEEKCVVV